MITGPDGHDAPTRNSAYGLLNLALDHVRLLIAVPLLVAIAAFLLATVRGPQYVATSMFAPESTGGSMAELGGLATQLGLGPALGGQDESVDFYARLAKAPALLEEVARRRFRFPVREGAEDTLAGALPDLLDIEGETEAERLRITVDVLSEAVEVEPDRSAGLVQVRTLVPWAGLAVDLNRAVLDGVSRFNLEKRQTSAAAERRFIEEQLDVAQADLEAAESALQRFLENNRRFENLPELRFEADRLERRVDLAQDLYLSLSQSLQKARIDEVRSTPTLTVLSPPDNTARKATSRLRTAIIGFLLGLALVLAYLYLHEYAARHRALAPDEYAGFRARARRLFRWRPGLPGRAGGPD